MNPSGHTINTLIDFHADTIPDRKYVVYPETGSSCTWKEFQQRVQSVACYLSGKGLSRQVPVAGLLGNGQTALELFLGGMYGGFQVLLANPLSGRDILAYVIEHSETKILFVAHQYQELAEQALSQLSNKPEIIHNHPDNLPAWNDTIPDKRLLKYIQTRKKRPCLFTHLEQQDVQRELYTLMKVFFMEAGTLRWLMNWRLMTTAYVYYRSATSTRRWFLLWVHLSTVQG
ncbi:MAG: hypothetical protein CM1200mP30_15750 [Pseudomonadota bacterium]|nr:MAG: hypothetical protein CM1200mP30_15750 [Pseudomonadota bacterium]